MAIKATKTEGGINVVVDGKSIGTGTGNLAGAAQVLRDQGVSEANILTAIKQVAGPEVLQRIEQAEANVAEEVQSLTKQREDKLAEARTASSAGQGTEQLAREVEDITQKIVEVQGGVKAPTGEIIQSPGLRRAITAQNRALAILTDVPGVEAPGGGFRLAVAIDAGKSRQQILDAGFTQKQFVAATKEAQAIRSAGAEAMVEAHSPAPGIERLTKARDRALAKLEAADPAEAELFKAGQPFSPVAAIRAGVSLKDLALITEASPTELLAAKRAAGRRSTSRSAAAESARDRVLAQLEAANSAEAERLRAGQQFSQAAAIQAGATTKDLALISEATPTEILAAKGAARRRTRADEARAERFAQALEAVRDFLTDIPDAFPEGERLGNRVQFDIDAAVQAGVPNRTLVDLGIAPVDILASEARIRRGARIEAREAKLAVAASKEDFLTQGKQVPRVLPSMIPRPTPRRVPRPGEKLPVPEGIGNTLDDIIRSSQVIRGSQGMFISPTDAQSVFVEGLAREIRRSIESGGLTPEEAAPLVEALQEQPVAGGELRDIGYIVPGLGSFLTYKDAQRSGFEPLETGFFAFSAALDALIFVSFLRGGRYRVRVIKKDAAEPVPAEVARREIERIGSQPRRTDVKVASKTAGGAEKFARDITRTELGGGGGESLVTASRGFDPQGRVLLVMRQPGRPPFPIWKPGDPLRSAGQLGPAPDPFKTRWTPGMFDDYLESLRRTGTDEQSLRDVLRRSKPATHDGTLPWERPGGGQAVAEGPRAALAQEFVIPHELATWERPAASRAAATRSLGAAKTAFALSTVKLAALVAQAEANPTPAERARIGAETQVLQLERTRAQLVGQLHAAFLEEVSPDVLVAGQQAQARAQPETQPIPFWQLPTTTTPAVETAIADAAQRQGLATAIGTKTNTRTLLSTETAIATSPASATATETQNRLATGAEVAPVSATTPRTGLLSTTAIKPTQGLAVAPSPATQGATKTATKTTTTAALATAGGGGETKRRRRLPGFELPGGRRLAPGVFARVVTWPQGENQVTANLQTGEVTWTDRVPDGTTPEQGFNVVEFTSKVPTRRRLEMGVMDVMYSKNGVEFARKRGRSKRQPSIFGRRRFG